MVLTKQILSYAFLGLTQGLTEFLPVSSSGHLVLAEHVLKVKSQSLLLEVSLHGATLAAVLLYFRKRLADIFRASAGGRGGWLRFVGLLAVASIPAALVGLFLNDKVEAAFDSVHAVGGFFFVTAAVLALSMLIKRREMTIAAMPWWAAAVVGCAQAVAVLPGVSRSGMTIVAAVLVGLAGSEAATFSFLLSVPAILGAIILHARDIRSWEGNWFGLGLGCLVAFVVGLAAIHIVLRTAPGRRFGLFAVWCVFVGLVAIFW